jgi:hypothetical protein
MVDGGPEWLDLIYFEDDARKVRRWIKIEKTARSSSTADRSILKKTRSYESK